MSIRTIGLLVLVLFEQATADPPAEKPPANSAAIAVVSSSDGTAIAQIAEFTRKVCACKDSACEQRVAGELAKWWDAAPKPKRLTREENGRDFQLEAEMRKCLKQVLPVEPLTPADHGQLTERLVHPTLAFSMLKPPPDFVESTPPMRDGLAYQFASQTGDQAVLLVVQHMSLAPTTAVDQAMQYDAMFLRSTANDKIELRIVGAEDSPVGHLRIASPARTVRGTFHTIQRRGYPLTVGIVVIAHDDHSLSNVLDSFEDAAPTAPITP